MNDVSAVIGALLHAMRMAGGVEDADHFEQTFSARGWQVDVTDQARVLARLQSITSSQVATPDAAVPASRSQSRVPEDPSPPPSAPTVPDPPAPPPKLTAFEDFAPWVATLPNQWQLVSHVHDVLRSRTIATLADAVGHVFVEDLDFERSFIDETYRVASQKTLTKVLTVARHDDFFVVVVESTYAGDYTTSFEPVFQLHPRCIIFSLEREVRIRASVRRSGSGQARLIGSRVLRGRGQRSFPEDDLLIWSARLAWLAPQHRDDGRALTQRADESVRASARDIASRWPTTPVNAARIPGTPWEKSAAQDTERFLQITSGTRVHDGLEAELHNSMSWSTSDGRVRVEYRRYHLIDMERDPGVAEIASATLSASVRLELEHRYQADDGEEVVNSFEIVGTIAVPDATGMFMIDGTPLLFCPGRIAAVSDSNDEFDEEEDDLEPDLDAAMESSPAPDGDIEVASPPPFETEDDLAPDARAGVYTGESVLPLLRWVVGRKLRALGVRFHRLPADKLATPGLVLAWLGRHCDGAGRLRLTAFSILRPHLETPGRERLRTIMTDVSAPPPAWACIELARELPAGHCYPIAGARIAPGGMLAAPMLDEAGSIRLAVSNTSALASNPRVRSTDLPLGGKPWIAASLHSFAHLPVGALEQPLRAALVGHAWQGLVFARSGPPTAFVVTKGRARTPPSHTRWVVDLPVHAHSREQPKLLVKPGQRLEPGDPLVGLEPPWTDFPDEHHLMEVGRRIHQEKVYAKVAQERKKQRQAEKGNEGTDATKNVRARAAALAVADEAEADLRNPPILIRCPSSSRGYVLAASVSTVKGVHGHAIGHRFTLDTRLDTIPEHVLLEDGRAVPIRWSATADLPWTSATGDTADAMLDVDVPNGASGEASTACTWQDGRTGDTVDGSALVRTLTLLPRAECRPPDPCIQYRVIDGWGQPRSRHEPSFTLEMMRLLICERPHEADVVHTVMREVHGHVPFATSVFELCCASHVRAPPFVPRDWSTEQESTGPTPTYDPIRNQLHRRTAAPYSSDADPWRWACDGEHLTGARFSQVLCPLCKTTVKRRWHGTTLPTISLPLPVLHPWRKHLLAALLGLSCGEFLGIERTQDCSTLVDATRNALAHPLRSLTHRLHRSSDPELVIQLTDQLRQLERGLSGDVRLEDIWLSEVNVLSPRLLFDGYRTGSPDLSDSPLTTRYRKLQGIASLRVQASSPTMRRAVWQGLQRSVDELFGCATGVPAAGTLAEMWRRVWPTTTPSRTPVAAPGLFEECTAEDLRRSVAAQLLASELPSSDQHWRHGILTAHGVRELTKPADVAPDPLDPRSWRERGAWARCTSHTLVRLAALFLGVDDQPSIVASLRGLSGAVALAEFPRLGPVVLRELVRRLQPPRGRPSRLLKILEIKEPSSLPRDRDAALQQLSPRLQGALPGEELGARMVREALARALTGFWRGASTTARSSVWIWSPSADQVPAGFHRAVPPLDSEAWHLWPSFFLLTEPMLAAVTGWQEDPSPGHRAWFGLPGLDLPELKETAMPTEVAMDRIPDVAHEAEPTAADLRILSYSLAQWFTAEVSARAHVET